jgi:tRNA 2-selenouridine synthase
MHVVKKSGVATVAQLSEFTEVIDARTPKEYAEDHIPGAINLPVLDNEERAKVGTLHKQVSAFEAKKAGAAMVSRHIAEHLENYFSNKPLSYKPLIYCWRGGNRSGAMTHVLQKIGFKAAQLEGGYKNYRRAVLAELDTLPTLFDFRVICGPTGSGKSRLLQALQAKGAQVLDLEELAAHRGSLLGDLPDQAQPSQKWLESSIWWQLKQFDPAKPVYVESESKKIGKLRVPDALLSAIRSGQSIWLEVATEHRVSLLLEEYAHFLSSPEVLLAQIAHLAELRGHETIKHWQALIKQERWDEFVHDMLENHYDPAYRKSLGKNYAESEASLKFRLPGISMNDFRHLADAILEKAG